MGISSGPAALPGLRLFSRVSMPLVLSVMLGILAGRYYRNVVIFLVNTKKKYPSSVYTLDVDVVLSCY